MKVKAPKGYHWMKQTKGGFKLMKHKGKFIKHKGATLMANFPIQKHIKNNNGDYIFTKYKRIA